MPHQDAGFKMNPTADIIVRVPAFAAVFAVMAGWECIAPKRKVALGRRRLRFTRPRNRRPTRDLSRGPWRLHRMHHTDLNIDVTTGVRFHPVVD